MQRTKRSILNVVVSFASYAVLLVTAFVVQHYLVTEKGAEYNAINGLFGNILTMMSLADLGIGTAIIYHMYKPVAQRDEDTINALLVFYKKCYLVISLIVVFIGIIIGFLVPVIVGENSIDDNIYVIFGFFVFDCLCSYFLAYKKSLLYADLRNYVADGIYFFVYIVQCVLQVMALVVYKDYLLFLVFKSGGKIFSNIFTSIYIKKAYPFVKERGVKKIPDETRADIVTKVKGLLFHKIGRILVTGSDSIVITSMLGLSVMNIYTNYRLVIAGIAALLNRVFETLTNSVGNLLIENSHEKNLLVYKRIDFINFECFGLVTAGMYAILRPLVIMWVGDEFLFAESVVWALCISFYMDGMKASVNTFKEAAGIFHEDRHIPVIEAVINLGLSIALASFMGALGVVIGTIVSTFVVFFYSYPKFVLKPLFGMKKSTYVIKTVCRLLVMCAVLGIIAVFDRFTVSMNPMASFVINGLFAVVVFTVVSIAIYGRSEEFRYCIELVTQRLHGGAKKAKK